MKFRMKRAPRMPYQPWHKVRRTGGGGRSFKTSQDDSKKRDSDLFVGYLVTEVGSIEEDELGDIVRTIQYHVEDGCPFKAWNLYFPGREFAKSDDVSKIVYAMISHFTRCPHWYDIEEIVSTQTLVLRLENINADELLENDWPMWNLDFKHRPEDVMNAVGLALHTLLQSDDDVKKYNQLKKIYVRPLSFNPMTNLNSVPSETVGELISTRGSIIHAGETEFITEVLCFRCSICSALIAVRQKKKDESERFLEPQKCAGTCKGERGMDALYDSPFTLCYSRQVITLQTISHNFNQTNRPIEMVVYRELTDAFAVGQEVIVTGIVKQVVEDSGDEQNLKFKSIFTKKKDKETNPIILKTYIKCFSMVSSFSDDEEKREAVISDDSDEMKMCKTHSSDPRIFKILLHSFCPHISGKEVAKAFTLFGVFGGHGLMKNFRRSSIHILLLGSTGTGKSAILQAAYEIAPKGMAISGANITLAGLTASCSEHMAADAGAIAMCDNGLLYIDELDKMEREQQQTLVSCMDSGVISIHKNGSFFKMNARANILAAANPCNEVYDYNEPIIANMRFPVDLLEKFDIVVPFLPNSDEDIEEFLQCHEEKRKLDESSSISQLENDFFNSTTSNDTPAKNYHWLKKDRNENLPRLSKGDIQTYVKCALDKCRPRLSRQAAELLKEFYQAYKVEIPHEYDDIWTRIHDMESLVRLTLARARIDFSETATLEHAQQVLSLFRAAHIDVYPHHDLAKNNLTHANLSMGGGGVKKTEDIAKMSKPKQMKAFMEYLQNKCDEKNRNVFTTAQMLEMAIDLGIRDYYEVINRLNYDGFVLKTPNGYKIVKNGF